MVDISYYYSSCVCVFYVIALIALNLGFAIHDDQYIARIITEERSFKSYLNVLYPEEKSRPKENLSVFTLAMSQIYRMHHIQ